MTSKKNVILFFTACALSNLAANFAHPVTPTIFTDLHLGSHMFGVALAAQLFTNFLFSPFWGKLSTYLSSRTVLLITSLGYAFGQVLFGLARTELSFIIARSLTGIFVGGVFVCVLTYIVNSTPDEQQCGKYLAVYATIQMVGAAFGFMVGGFLGEIFTYLAVIVQVICLALSGIMFYFVCVTDNQLRVKDIKGLTLVKEANPFTAFIESRKIMTFLFFMLFMSCLLSNLGYTAFDQTFNYYICDQFGFSSGYNGVIKGIMGFITLAANGTLCMHIINRTNSKRSIIGVLLACAGTMLLAILTDSLPLFIIFNVVFFAFNAVSVPILQNLVATKGAGAHSNLVMGVYNSMRSLGAVTGALFAGLLYTANPKLPFIFGFAAFGFATLCSVIYYKRTKNQS